MRLYAAAVAAAAAAAHALVQGDFKGFGHVEFATVEAATAAVALAGARLMEGQCGRGPLLTAHARAGTDMNGRQIRVDFAAQREKPAFGAGGGGARYAV